MSKAEQPKDEKKQWLQLQHHEKHLRAIKMPADLEKDMSEPPTTIDASIFDQVAGSMIGMALGDALGAHVEFRPYQYLQANPVKDLVGGGTWGLEKGQFTDDTSMALCLACSLVDKRVFNLYDQLVRYKWWYKHGYMSSTGQCFDIGNATRESLDTFECRQKDFAKKNSIPFDNMDSLSDLNLLNSFNVNCSEVGVAGNGALMRLAPVPLFFYRSPAHAVEYSGQSGRITHGDRKAYDACRYYGALIVAVLQGATKEELLDNNFYIKHKGWFGDLQLCKEILTISEGSYKRKGGYKEGIRGKGYIVNALEAALWAFWSDEDSFEKGALAAVNLGDDTDTTAAIYGQLAGAYYGYGELPKHWVKHVYAKKFILNICKWLIYEGSMCHPSSIQLMVRPTSSDSSNRKDRSNPILDEKEIPEIPVTILEDNPRTRDVLQLQSSININAEDYPGVHSEENSQTQFVDDTIGTKLSQIKPEQVIKVNGESASAPDQQRIVVNVSTLRDRYDRQQYALSQISASTIEPTITARPDSEKAERENDGKKNDEITKNVDDSKEISRSSTSITSETSTERDSHSQSMKHSVERKSIFHGILWRCNIL